MKLKDLLKDLEVLEMRGSGDVEIAGIEFDSRKVKKDFLFVAIPGFQADGQKFIPQAIENGATAIVSEGEFFDNTIQIRVSGARCALARLSATYFVHPTKSLYLAGVTGTNGKTTLTYLLNHLWKAAGFTPGLVGTIESRFGGIVLPASQTTPESRDLQKIFSDATNVSTTHMAIEVSSHSLDLYRVEGCHFDCGIFTNLTQDHLDFHKDFESYYLAKEKLFTKHLVESCKKNKLAIVCVEDEFGQRLANQCRKLKFQTLTYGFNAEADITVENLKLTLDGWSGTVKTPGQKLKITCSLMGRFNVLNCMAAIGAALHAKMDVSQIQEGIGSFRSVPGRLERIDDKGGRKIFVDYAHSPDALKNVLMTLKELAPKKIITVFGCGGDRDKTKRPLMGYEAAKFSDVTIVTSDNPRTEDPNQIISEIIPGIKNGKFIIESDRKKAIEKAIAEAGADDAVLIAGKGHEDYQIIGKTKYHFSDQEVVREIIK